MQLYMDGINAPVSVSGVGIGVVIDSVSQVRVAQRLSTLASLQFHGKIGVIQMYNVVLSYGEILQNYNAFSSRYLNTPQNIFYSNGALTLGMNSLSSLTDTFYVNGTSTFRGNISQPSGLLNGCTFRGASGSSYIAPLRNVRRANLMNYDPSSNEIGYATPIRLTSQSIINAVVSSWNNSVSITIPSNSTFKVEVILTSDYNPSYGLPNSSQPAWVG
jgi:hypothetical protein